MECVYNHNGITCACATDGRTTCRYWPMLQEVPGTMPEPDVRRTDLSKPLFDCGCTHAASACVLPNCPRLHVNAGSAPQLGINPKDLLGAKKVDLSLVPTIGIWHEACAFLDGGIEYGPYNWRDNAVQARVYIAAARRHIDEYEARLDYTSDTGVHSLGAARACLGILLDADMTGNLIDNRPPHAASVFQIMTDKLNAWAKARVAKGRYRNV